MNSTSNRARSIGAALMTLAIVAAAGPVYAVEPNSNPIILSPGELQNLNNRQRRLDFQQRQQFNREIDSQSIRRPQRIEVPVMKPRCPLRTFGNQAISGNCR